MTGVICAKWINIAKHSFAVYVFNIHYIFSWSPKENMQIKLRNGRQRARKKWDWANEILAIEVIPIIMVELNMHAYTLHTDTQTLNRYVYFIVT